MLMKTTYITRSSLRLFSLQPPPRLRELPDRRASSRTGTLIRITQMKKCGSITPRATFGDCALSRLLKRFSEKATSARSSKASQPKAPDDRAFPS